MPRLIRFQLVAVLIAVAGPGCEISEGDGDLFDGLGPVIKAGYAEYGRDDVHKDRKLWLRGGRQFRLDGGAMFAYFDGVTVGANATTTGDAGLQIEVTGGTTRAVV